MRYVKIPEPVTLADPVTGAPGDVMTFLRICITVPLSNREVWGKSMESMFAHRKVRERIGEACSLAEVHDGEDEAYREVHVALEDNEFKLLKEALEDRAGLGKSGVVLNPISESQVLDHYEAILEARKHKPSSGLLVTGEEVVDLDAAKAAK